jgi:hypothetical protein
MVDMQLHIVVNKSSSGWTLAISYGGFFYVKCAAYAAVKVVVCGHVMKAWCRGGIAALILNFDSSWW